MMRKPITINEDDGDADGDAELKLQAEKIRGKMRRCVSMPSMWLNVTPIMKFRTLDESLHSTYGSECGGDRGIQFDQVFIREYARTVGDNPSCSSGPPVSIGWEYNVVGNVPLSEYENTRPARRSHFEMVLPRKVRQDMLRREWEVSQKQIADSVRRNVKTKNHRKATVNNLGKATKMEEFMESAGRKVRRFITFQKPVSHQVKDLEDKLNMSNRIRSQLRMEYAMSSDYSDKEAPEAAQSSNSSS